VGRLGAWESGWGMWTGSEPELTTLSGKGMAFSVSQAGRARQQETPSTHSLCLGPGLAGHTGWEELPCVFIRSDPRGPEAGAFHT
jgi:hypothetical protein